MESYLGQIIIVAFNYAPRGHALCNGQLMSIAQNQALFALLGTTYGGDGRTTFALPDLRGRAPVHAGAGLGLSARTLGEQAGAETIRLNADQLPVHSHTLLARDAAGDQSAPGGNALARESAVQTAIYRSGAPDVVMNSGSISVAPGANQLINSLAPYLSLNFAIVLSGLFPSSN